MNNQSGTLAGGGAIVPFDRRELAAATGLRDVMVAEGGGPGEQRITPSEVWRVIVKWWWLIVAIAFVCVVTSVVLSLLVQPEYRAKSTLEVNREGVQVVQMGQIETMEMGDREFITTQAGLLRSRALAERVARSLNIAGNDKLFDQQLPRAVREAQAAGLVQTIIAVNPIRDSRLIELTVESTDPELAAKVANAYGDNFIQSNLERRFEANSYARNFLEQRLANIRKKLEDTERQLVAYAQQQGIVSLNVDTGSGGPRSEQSVDAASLTSINNALQQARADRIAAEQKVRQSQGSRATTEVLANGTIQGLVAQRAELQAQYQEKLGLFQPDYPAMAQMRARIQSLDKAINQEVGNVGGSLQGEYQAALGRERQLEAKVNQLKAALLNLRGRSIQYTILQREVDTNRALYDSLLQRYKEVGVAGGLGSNIVSIVDRAQVPTAPFKPNLPFNVLIGLIGGLLLGFGAAFALEWMDDTIKTPDDLTGKLGIPALGVVPRADKEASLQEQLADPRSQVTEAYQSIRTALQFSTDHGIPKSLLITSTRASEGKSSTALALAQILSKLGASVLLIDGDLRKPTFKGPAGSDLGLTTLLAGSGTVKDAVQPTEHEGLHLLPAGRIPPNPAELLASGRVSAVLEQAGAMFDFVVVDGPPVLGLADAPLLSFHCEGTVMVIESGAIRRGAALNAVKRLRAADARIMGGVLTKFSATKSGYGYGYGYGYGDDQYTYREGIETKTQIKLSKEANTAEA
jgi:capsular exopolysaccharide synthesis family protein